MTQSKTVRLSRPAFEIFAEVRQSLKELMPLHFDDEPSASVSIEFLAWWFDQTRGMDGAPNPRKWSAKTKKGRPSVGADAIPVSPSKLRKGTGLVPVVARRKL